MKWSAAILCNDRWPAGFTFLVNHVASAKNFPPRRWQLDDDSPSSTQLRQSLDADEALLVRAIAGDQRSWQQLFDRWKKPLLVFFYRSLGSLAEAEDLTLEVFVRLHRSGTRYEPRAAFATYLFHIARNLLLNELRRRRRKPTKPVPADEFDYLAQPDDDASRRAAELEEAFQRALLQLPESQRTLLLLVGQQGLQPAVVARMLSVNENALRVQLHRARQRLKELMSAQP